MRAKEFIQESRENGMEDDVAEAIPSAFVIPALPNQDPYKQYRFGVALANARANKAKDDVIKRDTFQAKSPWGENAIVISYTNTTKDIIDDALNQIGLSSSAKKQITSTGSHETKDVNKSSPVATKKRNRFGV
jgi:hypothetical protein